MPHFFCPPDGISGDTFRLSPDESRHAAASLRKKIGDEISFFDGEGNSYRGLITSLDGGIVSGDIIRSSPSRPRRCDAPEILFYQAVPKKQKFDEIIDKLSQLGVSKIVPVTTERTIVRIPPADVGRKLAGWRAAAVASAKQCGRADILEVAPPLDFPSAVSAAASSGFPTIIAWEGEKRNAKKILSALARPLSGLNVFIGPEGGFSMREIELARSAASAVTLGLGPRILRAEAAAAAVAATLDYEFSPDDEAPPSSSGGKSPAAE